MRRNRILSLLDSSPLPLSGSALARQLGVSRQVIVQDIALLRAEQQDILATTRGYIRSQNMAATRVFVVQHTPAQTALELDLIIGHGGCVRSLEIDHPAHGCIHVALQLATQPEIADYLSRVAASTPLHVLTDGLHRHLVTAPSEAVLDRIAGALEAHRLLQAETLPFAAP